MNQLLKPGQTVQTASSGMVCRVEKLLGEGSQGEVYQANLGGSSVALKWYFPQSPFATPKHQRNLETLVKKGPPNTKFLWPMELTTADGVQGFGYIMPLLDTRHKAMNDLLFARINPTFRTLATAGL